jgi:sugar/nucleoside kinase (ribokinase family)
LILLIQRRGLRRNILRLVEILPKLAEKFEVYLGFNLRESTFIARALGLTEPASSPLDVLTYSQQLRERIRIDGVVIHWSRYAAGSNANSSVCVEAPFTDNPKISTGAGDHFNAGFCLGRLLGGDLNANIQLGVATSEYYVRQAHSPTLTQLIEFVETLS